MRQISEFISYFCLVPVFSLLGCVGNQAYRRGDVLPNQGPPSIDRVDSSVTTCGAAIPCARSLDGKIGPQHFYLSYIEFDDMGELWSIGDLHGVADRSKDAHASQLEQTIATIQRAKDEARRENTELVVVTFVHGWKNNASSYNERKKNLAGFKTVLQELSDYPALINPSKKTIVVGIFIAWRGQVLAGNLFSSYWNRRDAATRVGGPSMTEAISRLMFATKDAPSSPSQQNRCQNPDPDPNSHFIIIGHSFGARVLERALTQPIITLLLERQSQAESCINSWNALHPADQVQSVGFQSPTDLIVFLNAANDAFETKATIEDLKRSHLTAQRQDEGGVYFPGPLLLSVTSAGDYATGRIMPVAQTLSIPGRAFRQYDKNACSEGQIGLKGQTYFFRHNDGNIPEMRSHTVQYLPSITSEDKCGGDWPFFWASADGHGRCFKIEALEEGPVDALNQNCPGTLPARPWNDTPFFVMHVPSELIPSHTDIFQDGTIELLLSMIDNYNVRSPMLMVVPAPSKHAPLSKSDK
jgi:hypothetical protein